MIASTHLTVSATIGAYLYRLLKPKKIGGIILVSFLSLILGICSHFILDSIPHSEYGNISRGPLVIVLFAELFLVAFLTYHLAIRRLRSRNYPEAIIIVAGMVGGALPDISYVVYYLFGIKWEFLLSTININMYFHSTSYLNVLISFPIQIFISALALYILYSLVIKNSKS